MTICEDCGDEVVRRVRCAECGRLVCPYCYHHAFHKRTQREAESKEAKA
jgi:hypothetical protein